MEWSGETHNILCFETERIRGLVRSCSRGLTLDASSVCRSSRIGSRCLSCSTGRYSNLKCMYECWWEAEELIFISRAEPD